MISDRIKRDAYLRKLATMISIDERLLHDELQQVVRGQKVNSVVATFSASSGQQQGSRQGIGMSSADMMEEEAGEKAVHRQQQGQAAAGLDKRKANKLKWEDYLIGLLLTNPELSSEVCAIITDGDFAGTDTRELYRIFNSVNQRGASPLFQALEQAVPSALFETLERARKSIESRSPLEGAGLRKSAIQCATRLRRASLLQLNTEIRYLMKEAGEAGDAEAERQFRQKLLTVHQQLRTIDSAIHLQG
jgi:DNA primase